MVRRPTLIIGIPALLFCALYLLFLYPLRNPHPAPRPLATGVLAIVDARLYLAPEIPPMERATILVHDGVIAALGASLAVPADARRLACDHCVVTAGFWNAHIHFNEPKWNSAWSASASSLNPQLADMLTSRGFTTVVDVGSDLRITLSLRRRIESGELGGPAIYTAGSPLYPPNGIPYYLKESLPFFVRWILPQPATPAEAARAVERNIHNGADVLKLFTGSIVARGKVLPMSEPIARAAVEVAHRHGQLAYAHPSDFEGTRVAIASGVDILAHAPNSTAGIDDALLASAVKRNMAMIPTLKMFATTVSTKPDFLDPIHAVVRRYHGLGGQLIFGTDVGYMTDYSTGDEFRELEKCGLGVADVLRMLTVAPAERFGVAAHRGTLGVGKQADLVVLDADPAAAGITAFERVRYTVRGGEVIFSRQ